MESMQRPGLMPWLQNPQVSRLAWGMGSAGLLLAGTPLDSSPDYLTATLSKDQSLVQWLQDLSVDPVTIQTVSKQCWLSLTLSLTPTNQGRCLTLSSSSPKVFSTTETFHAGRALSMLLSLDGWGN